MSVSYARASRIASSCPRDFNFADFMYSSEADYPMGISVKHLLEFMESRPESVAWNTLVAMLTIFSFFFTSMEYKSSETMAGIRYTDYLDIAYNAVYLLHVVANFYRDHGHENLNMKWYLVDVISYVHYLTSYIPEAIVKKYPEHEHYIVLFCYHLRLHRPFTFLWGLNDHYLKGSMLACLLKYWYIFALMHIMCTNVFLWMGMVTSPNYKEIPEFLNSSRSLLFYRGFYVVYKRFIPIGIDHPSDVKDTFSLMIDLTGLIVGSLLVSGITSASLTLALGLHLFPGEMFKARVRLILEDMKAARVPNALREKVDTFYRMYWHKQRAVSIAILLPTYPPSLANTIYTDIYFEALQRSIVLRDLSYQFLSEIAQKMKTVNYIPGDFLIRRDAFKFAMIYISYGDVEMMSAEDDETPILRFTRGSIMNPCAGAAAVAASHSYVCIRAATFCTAHILMAADIWRVSARYGQFHGQGFIWHSSFEEHMEKVARHYAARPVQAVKHKSTIHVLKRNLIELKEARDEFGELILGRQDMFLELAGCYIMRNSSDATLAEESDSICLRSAFPCILQPMSSLLYMWNVLVSICTLVVAFIHPYNLVFVGGPVKTDFKFFDFMITLVYMADLLIHLATGVKIEEGTPITFYQTSSHQVSSFWFVMDLLSVVPIFEFLGKGKMAGLNKLFKLPKVFKVLKEMEDVSIYQSTVFRFIAYCLLIALVNWLVATMQQAYMCLYQSQCNVRTLIKEPFWMNDKEDDSNEAAQMRLVFGLYWAVHFTTFTAHKTSKAAMVDYHMQAFTMLMLESLSKFHVILEAMYSATIMVKQTMRDQYNECINNVKMFLVNNDVDPVLRHRFINYLQLCWYTDKAYSITHEKHSIHFDLPQHVYQDISALQRNKYILAVPFMKFLPNDIVRKICSDAHLFYTSPNEILLNTGDICNEVYVIKRGFCEMVDPMTRNVVSVLSAKNHFGDVECLMRLPAYYTVRAVSHVQIFSISRKDLAPAMNVPKLKDAIDHAKEQPEYRQLQRNQQQSFLKYVTPKPATNREVFPVLRKHIPDTAFLEPFQRLGFLSIARYIFPRFTIRPDGAYLRRYEWFRAMCALLISVVAPTYYLMYPQFPVLTALMYTLDFCAYFDLVQRLLIAYFDENGILVYHPVSTAVHYIRGPIVADLLACLPLELVDDLKRKMFTNAEYTWTPPSMQFLLCNRILQLYRFPAALEVLNEYIDRQDIVFVIKVIPMLMVFINTMSAFLVQFSVRTHAVNGGGWVIYPESYGNPSWIISDSDKVGYNITGTPLNLLLTTYYWATYEITTTGLDCFHPDRSEQIYVFIIGMLIGSIMITYFAVRVLSIRSSVNQALASFQENMKDLVVFMERERCNWELYEEALSYYEHTWEKTGGTDYRNILKLCDQITLRTDAILHIYGQTFHKCPILYHSDLSLQRLVGRAAHSVYYREGMTVVERDDVTQHVYFVDYGIMEARDPEDDDIINTKLPRGSMFGNLENQLMVLSPNKFVANTNVHLLRIETWLFYKVLADFPAIGDRMVKFRPNKENYIIASLRATSVAQPGWKDKSQSVATTIIVTQNELLKYLHRHAKAFQVMVIITSMISVYGDLYNAAFQYNRFKFVATLYIMDLACLFKVVINYLIPTITEEQSESTNALTKARKGYFRGEFKYDFVSILPIEAFCFLFNDPWSAFAYLRLNRTARVTSIHSNLRLYHKRLSINLTATTIITTLIWFTLFVHVCTCIWYLLGVINDSIEPKSSWRWDFRHNGTYFCDNDYMCSFYFVMTTFSQNGVGDILPRQQVEVVFAILLMILSTMMYMIYVGEFSNIMQYQFHRCFSFYKEFVELKEFLKYNNVSKNLGELTHKYTLHLWRTSRGLQVPRFLADAPPCLRQKLMSAAYMRHLKKHPAFKRCEAPFLRHVVAHFKPFTYHEDMHVVREGEITDSMYFIHKGTVQESIENFDEVCDELLEEGQWFGTKQGLHHEIPFAHTYKTVSKAQVLTLSITDWEYLLDHFPHNRAKIYRVYKDADAYQGVTKAKKRVMMKSGTNVRHFSKDKLTTASSTKPQPEQKARKSEEIDFSKIKGRTSDHMLVSKSRETLQSMSDKVDLNGKPLEALKAPSSDTSLKSLKEKTSVGDKSIITLIPVTDDKEEDEDKEASKETDANPPKFVRRNSVFHGAAELELLDEDDDENENKTLQHSATARELKDIDSSSPSTSQTKPFVGQRSSISSRTMPNFSGPSSSASTSQERGGPSGLPKSALGKKSQVQESLPAASTSSYKSKKFLDRVQSVKLKKDREDDLRAEQEEATTSSLLKTFEDKISRAPATLTSRVRSGGGGISFRDEDEDSGIAVKKSVGRMTVVDADDSADDNDDEDKSKKTK